MLNVNWVETFGPRLEAVHSRTDAEPTGDSAYKLIAIECDAEGGTRIQE
jgi:hypothetical protein